MTQSYMNTVEPFNQCSMPSGWKNQKLSLGWVKPELRGRLGVMGDGSWLEAFQ